MLTGQSPRRYAIGHLLNSKPEDIPGELYAGQRGLPSQDVTMADGLKAEGYRTMFIGKWHIGSAKPSFLPGGQGFERFTVQVGDNPAAGSFRGLTETGNRTISTVWQSQYAAEDIISYMDQTLSAGENVFVTWSPPEPHAAATPDGSPFYVPPTFDRAASDRDAGGKSLDTSTNRGKLVTMMYAFDAQFGRVVDFIKQKNLYDDALIVVTSDNGGASGGLGPSHELKEGKGTMFEGGLRVPFAASWPKRFAAGTHTSRTLSAFDLYPTLLGLIGGAVPTGLEGVNMASLLLNGTGDRGPLFFELRRSDLRKSDDELITDTSAYIDGCDKFVINFNVEYLYNVCEDPTERTNLAERNPGRLNSLRSAMRGHRLRISTFVAPNSISSGMVLSANERLNTASDDLSIYASVNLGSSATGSHNVYRHGDGIDLRIENGRLVARIVGVADASRAPALRTLSLDAAIPADGRSHRLGLVIRGYLNGGSTISLYVDGQLKSRVQAPLNVAFNAGTSVMAVRAENVDALLGESGITLSNVLVLTNAIEPGEF